MVVFDFGIYNSMGQLVEQLKRKKQHISKNYQIQLPRSIMTCIFWKLLMQMVAQHQIYHPLKPHSMKKYIIIFLLSVVPVLLRAQSYTNALITNVLHIQIHWQNYLSSLIEPGTQ